MRGKVKRWGNSLAVRIPKAFAAELGVDEDSEVEIALAADALVISARIPRPSLRSLVGRITPENVHEEVDFGKPVGREHW